MNDLRGNFVESQAYFTHITYFTYAHRAMNDVENLYAFGSDAVDDQMGVENDIAVHTTFCRKVATFGVIGVVCVEPFNEVRDEIKIFFCLQISEHTNTILKYFHQMLFVIGGRNYLF